MPKYLRVPAIRAVEVQHWLTGVFRECDAAILAVGDVLNLFVWLAQSINCYQTDVGEKPAGILGVSNYAAGKNLSLRPVWNRDGCIPIPSHRRTLARRQ